MTAAVEGEDMEPLATVTGSRHGPLPRTSCPARHAIAAPEPAPRSRSPGKGLDRSQAKRPRKKVSKKAGPQGKGLIATPTLDLEPPSGLAPSGTVVAKAQDAGS